MKNTIPILLGCLLFSGISSANTHPFNIHDLNALKRIGSPQISPNGKQVAFTLKETNTKTNVHSTHIWSIDLENDFKTKRLSKQHALSNYTPIWSSKGEYIYYLSKHKNSFQIWRMKANGTRHKQISHLPIGIDNLSLSPDNRWLAFTADVHPNCSDLNCTVDKDKKLKNASRSGIVYEQLFIRHWDQWDNGKQTHLFTLKLNEKGLPEGSPISISTRLNANVPPKPFGGKSDFTFTADSKHLIFTARMAEPDQAWKTNLDLFKAAVDGSGPILNLTKPNKALDTHPIVSPDGKWLAYLAMRRAGFESDRLLINLVDLSSGKHSILTEQWDRSVSDMKFSRDSQTIFMTANSIGQKPIFSITLKDKTLHQLTDQGHVSSFDVNNNTIIYSLSTLASPNKLFQSDFEGNNIKPISYFNKMHLSEIEMGEYKQFSFKGWNNEKVYGYIIKPVGFDEKKTYPAILFIHGGPQGNFDNRFHSRWNSQIFSGAGYAVIMIDFHGSTGYGQAFTDSISKDWGGKPLVDLQKGLHAALEKSPWIQANRICAMGGSYGGYMVNWIAGAWPDRFKCLVNHDGVLDNRMMYYTTEELWFPEWEHGGPYYQNPQGHEKHNPINHIKNWRTPMFIIHGAFDFRIPETQAIATFTALQRRGIKSRFLYYPDENHWVLGTHNKIQWHEEILKWLDEHLKQ